jgi:hypothetical protein
VKEYNNGKATFPLMGSALFNDFLSAIKYSYSPFHMRFRDEAGIADIPPSMLKGR